LYIHRGITGAVVGRQPFGGHKASNFGPGVKAGGPFYVGELAQLTPKVRRAIPRSAPRPPGPRFPEDVPGTHVVGEANWLRYLPAEVVVVGGREASWTELEYTLTPAERVQGRVTVYRSPRPSDHQSAHARSAETLRATRALQAIIEDTGRTRLRLI